MASRARHQRSAAARRKRREEEGLARRETELGDPHGEDLLAAEDDDQEHRGVALREGAEVAEGTIPAASDAPLAQHRDGHHHAQRCDQRLREEWGTGTVSYSSAICVCEQGGERIEMNTVVYSSAISAREQGGERGEMNTVDYNSAISACEQGRERVEMNTVKCSSAINAYGQGGEWEETSALLNQQEEKNAGQVEKEEKRVSPSRSLGSTSQVGGTSPSPTIFDEDFEEAIEKVQPYFGIGALVLVCGLKNAKELNGRRGIIVQFIPETSRYSVSITGEFKPKALKPENLKIHP